MAASFLGHKDKNLKASQLWQGENVKVHYNRKVTLVSIFFGPLHNVECTYIKCMYGFPTILGVNSFAYNLTPKMSLSIGVCKYSAHHEMINIEYLLYVKLFSMS